MSITPTSKEASRRTNAARQRRWRSRQRSLRTATEHLQRELGRKPTEEEIYSELEKRLGRDPVLRAKTEAPVLDEHRTGVASRSMEMMVASQRHEVFDLLMSSAKGGDVSSILFLAGRLMPVPKARDYIRLSNLEGVDLRGRLRSARRPGEREAEGSCQRFRKGAALP